MEQEIAGYMKIGGSPFRQFAAARLASHMRRRAEHSKGLMTINEALTRSSPAVKGCLTRRCSGSKVRVRSC
jgi:hypothetical protein